MTERNIGVTKRIILFLEVTDLRHTPPRGPGQRRRQAVPRGGRWAPQGPPAAERRAELK